MAILKPERLQQPQVANGGSHQQALGGRNGSPMLGVGNKGREPDA